MKTTPINTRVVVCLAMLTAAATVRTRADQVTATAKPERTHTGMVTSIDPQAQTVRVKWFLMNRKFNLGSPCVFMLPNQSPGTINDLRRGQKVTVSYQDAHGVLVADRIEQRPMRYEGMVKVIDPEAHKLTLHVHAWDKAFLVGDECKVRLRNDESGTLADLKPGHHVVVVYETPSGTPIARQIDQTSATFNGTLNAIDASDRTIKAKHLTGNKTFHLADGCAIVIDGNAAGRLVDLKLGDKLSLSYDEINGVNVVSRIATLEEPRHTLAQGPDRGR